MPSPLNKQYAEDENGFPILFAAESPARHKLVDPELPELVTPDATSGRAEWGRYSDAVREASRSFDKSKGGDIHQFLQARARNPEKVDIPAFREAVHRQRMADLVDIVDNHLRRDGPLHRGHRMVRVQAPKGYVRRALRQLPPEDVAHLRHRLHAIGHSQEDVDKHLSDRIAPDMWDQATDYEVRMADGEFEGLIFDADDFDVEWENPLEDVIEAIAEMQKNMPPPVINVYVNTENGDAHD